MGAFANVPPDALARSLLASPAASLDAAPSREDLQRLERRRLTTMRTFTASLAPLAASVVLLGALLPAVSAQAGKGRARAMKTGQGNMCWDTNGDPISCNGTGQDGELKRGLGHSYVDNGDGTVKDERTKLIWEKLSDDGSIHDVDDTYSWAGAFAKVDTLNTLPCFAGSCDWRLPSINELFTLANFGEVDPAVFPAFNSGCSAGCTVTTCSCTASSHYWSSSTNAASTAFAWFVFFNVSFVGSDSKANPHHVRAVRGGS